MDRPVTFEPNTRGELASSGPRWKPVRAAGGMQPVAPHDLLWITDRDLVVTWLNSAAADFLGRAPAECIGRSVLTWLPADLRRECERSARACLGDRTHPGLRIEGLLQSGQGRALEVEWSLDPLYGARAELQGFACWASDLSDRRVVEARLAESETRLQAVVEALLDPMVSIDDHGLILAANSSVERVLGWPPHELLGQNIKVLMPEPHRSRHDAYLATYRTTGQTWILGRTRDFEVVRKDGTLLVCALSVSRADLSQGRGRVFTGTFRDVTEKRRAEQRLQESELRFHGLFDHSYEYLGMLTPDGRVIEANRTALEGAGLAREDVIGRLFWETKWWSHSPEQQRRVEQAVLAAAQGEFVRFEAVHPAQDGSLVEMDFSLKPVRDGEGRVVMLIPEGRNISEIKRAQRAETGMLRALATIGESAALLAHEIKNPITAVNVALRAVADKLGEDQREVLEDLVARMRRLEQMMKRTLSFARALELRRASIDAKEFLARCVAHLGPQLERGGASVRVDVSEDAGCVSIDPGLLEEVIANLVLNAMEASRGQARIVLAACPADQGHVLLSVDDDGPGIPESVRATLFKPFITTKQDGNGFGLAICKKIVEEHGGTLQAGPSALGGARFEIRLARKP